MRLVPHTGFRARRLLGQVIGAVREHPTPARSALSGRSICSDSGQELSQLSQAQVDNHSGLAADPCQLAR